MRNLLLLVALLGLTGCMKAVSYTHLDVYKRQSVAATSTSRPAPRWMPLRCATPFPVQAISA